MITATVTSLSADVSSCLKSIPNFRFFQWRERTGLLKIASLLKGKNSRCLFIENISILYIFSVQRLFSSGLNFSQILLFLVTQKLPSGSFEIFQANTDLGRESSATSMQNWCRSKHLCWNDTHLGGLVVKA